MPNRPTLSKKEYYQLMFYEILTLIITPIFLSLPFIVFYTGFMSASDVAIGTLCGLVYSSYKISSMLHRIGTSESDSTDFDVSAFMVIDSLVWVACSVFFLTQQYQLLTTFSLLEIFSIWCGIQLTAPILLYMVDVLPIFTFLKCYISQILLSFCLLVPLPNPINIAILHQFLSPFPEEMPPLNNVLIKGLVTNTVSVALMVGYLRQKIRLEILFSGHLPETNYETDSQSSDDSETNGLLTNS